MSLNSFSVRSPTVHGLFQKQKPNAVRSNAAATVSVSGVTKNRLGSFLTSRLSCAVRVPSRFVVRRSTHAFTRSCARLVFTPTDDNAPAIAIARTAFEFTSRLFSSHQSRNAHTFSHLCCA